MMDEFKLLPLTILLLAVLITAACAGQPVTAVASTGALGLKPLSAPAVEAAVASRNPFNCAMPRGEPVVIADAKLYVEYNATDGDLGVHGAFDDHGWSELCVYAPGGEQILAVKPRAQLGDLTMAGIFFESREPELSEFAFDDLAARFPEGQYEVRGLNFDGTSLVGAATFSHNVPAEPKITSPELAEDEETANEALVPIRRLVVTWRAVTKTVSGEPLRITGYEVIITQVEHEDPHGFSRPVYDVHLPPDRRRLSVPVEFLQPDTVYELELLALEESGNQTISVGFFTTAD
jgi:hypothetical protein